MRSLKVRGSGVTMIHWKTIPYLDGALVTSLCGLYHVTRSELTNQWRATFTRPDGVGVVLNPFSLPLAQSTYLAEQHARSVEGMTLATEPPTSNPARDASLFDLQAEVQVRAAEKTTVSAATRDERTQLRDRFAGQAMMGYLANPACSGEVELVSRWAYKCADAMIVERENTTP